jgi:hypothetical protein
LLIIVFKLISGESIFLASPSDQNIRVGGVADFSCYTRPEYRGYRRWMLTRPYGESLVLTNGEHIAEQYSHAMHVFNDVNMANNNANFHLRVYITDIDDQKWAGLYSCSVNKDGVFAEKTATLRIIGEFCGDVMRL